MYILLFVNQKKLFSYHKKNIKIKMLDCVILLFKFTNSKVTGVPNLMSFLKQSTIGTEGKTNCNLA